MMHVFAAEKNDFLNVCFSGKRRSSWIISVNQQSKERNFKVSTELAHKCKSY